MATLNGVPLPRSENYREPKGDRLAEILIEMGKEREKEFAELEKQYPPISQEEFEQQQLDYLKTLPDQMKQMIRPVSLFLGEHDVLTDTIMLGIVGNIKDLALLNVFMCNKLTDVALTTTANFQCSRGLKNLTLAFCTGLTDESLRAVGENCQELEKLDMQGCELMTSKGIKALANGCRKLNFLRIADCKKIDDTGVQKIGENCPEMEELDLENCKAVTDVGIIAIAEGCPNLKNLKFNRCKRVTNKGMIALSDNCRKLEELDVWHCPKLTDIRVEKLFVETCKISGLLGSIHTPKGLYRLDPALFGENDDINLGQLMI